MAYLFVKNETVEENITRIAEEQAQSAIDEINDQNLGRHVVVHEVRKRCKKMRGLIRIVRPQFESTFKQENAWYADASRELSYLRDAQSIIETFDKLMSRFAEELAPETFSSIKAELVERRRKVTEDKDGLLKHLDIFLDLIQEGQTRITSWSLENKDGFDALAGGLQKTYSRGCKALALTFLEPTMENFHQWRKRVKYHLYHVRMLVDIWPQFMTAYHDEVDRLAEYLGDEHDLGVLLETILAQAESFGNESVIESILPFIDRRREEIRTDAQNLGRRIYVEKPERLVRRLEAYWDVWQEEEDGEI